MMLDLPIGSLMDPQDWVSGLVEWSPWRWPDSPDHSDSNRNRQQSQTSWIKVRIWIIKSIVAMTDSRQADAASNSNHPHSWLYTWNETDGSAAMKSWRLTAGRDWSDGDKWSDGDQTTIVIVIWRNMAMVFNCILSWKAHAQNLDIYLSWRRENSDQETSPVTEQDPEASQLWWKNSYIVTVERECNETGCAYEQIIPEAEDPSCNLKEWGRQNARAKFRRKDGTVQTGSRE